LHTADLERMQQTLAKLWPLPGQDRR